MSFSLEKRSKKNDFRSFFGDDFSRRGAKLRWLRFKPKIAKIRWGVVAPWIFKAGSATHFSYFHFFFRYLSRNNSATNGARIENRHVSERIRSARFNGHNEDSLRLTTRPLLIFPQNNFFFFYDNFEPESDPHIDFDVMCDQDLKTKVLHFTGLIYLVSLMLQRPLKG